jgi:glycosyltransferase involved in cell wall biosynthesis
VIITIHGLRALELPTDKYEWFYCKDMRSRIKFLYKNFMPGKYERSLRRYFRNFLDSSRIITVSDQSRNELLRFFPDLSPEKISTFYSPLLSYSQNGVNEDNILKSSGLVRGKYFLLLSGSIWTKNSYRVIKTFDGILSEDHDYKDMKMIVTGVSREFFTVRNRENFVFTGYLERNVLEAILKNALSLVYPTLNEGFGYPPLEAMKYGVPVLASRINPIVEVCGNAAYFFDPRDKKDIRMKLRYAMNNHEIYSENKIHERVSRYQYISKRQEDDLNNMVELLCQPVN